MGDEKNFRPNSSMSRLIRERDAQQAIADLEWRNPRGVGAHAGSVAPLETAAEIIFCSHRSA